MSIVGAHIYYAGTLKLSAVGCHGEEAMLTLNPERTTSNDIACSTNMQRNKGNAWTR